MYSLFYWQTQIEEYLVNNKTTTFKYRFTQEYIFQGLLQNQSSLDLYSNYKCPVE